MAVTDVNAVFFVDKAHLADEHVSGGLNAKDLQHFHHVVGDCALRVDEGKAEHVPKVGALGFDNVLIAVD